MLVFRSEEHIERWRETWNQPRGATMTLEQMWALSCAWYGPNRGDPDWQRPTVEGAEALFASIGLTGPFWKLGH